MGRADLLKDKHKKGNCPSVDNDEDSAARTRPFSFEEIMVRRRNKDFLENVKGPAKEAWNISPGDSLEKISDHFESPRIHKHDKISSFSMEKHSSDEPVNISSRKKVESTYVMEGDLTDRRDRSRTNNILESESSAGLNNKGRIPNRRMGKEMGDWRENELISENSEKSGNKHSRDSVNKDSHAEEIRPKSERNPKKKNHIEEDENPNEYSTERKHDKDRHDGWKIKKRLSNDSAEVPEKKHHRDSDKGKHAEGRAKFEREIQRKYRNGDDEAWDRNAIRKQDIAKHHNPHVYERKDKWEKVKSHCEESTMKRKRSRSWEREDRRRSPSFSPRAHKNNYRDGECKELSMLSMKDSSRKKNSDVDRNRVSTNVSSSHHRRHRHGDSASGLGGYSPRKRRSEMDVKTPSPKKRKSETVTTPLPSKHSLEKKRAGWDLPPVGTDNASAFVSSGFQLSNCSVLSSMHDVTSAISLNPAIVKPLQMSFLNAASIGKNSNVDSVQLTQATRPMRRLYLENLPASACEKVVMDCFNNLLLSSGVNQIKQTKPCISCIIHKERGQALVEFLTAEDASAALSFDGSTLFGSQVKVRRPKDYVEVATGEPERSVDVADTTSAVAETTSAVAETISDMVIDSPNKIFIGGISNNVSSQMLMEIVGAFGSLKAYHFQARVCNDSCAFVEYVDHFATIKACAGMNGMKLGGEVLAVFQAMPDTSPLEIGSTHPSYEIPEIAKPLLRKPTQILEIKNVFTVESILSLSDVAMEEILEDVRLECARFGTVQSINVVKHKDDNDSSVEVDKNAELFNNTPCQEHLASNTTVKDVGNKSTPRSIVEGSSDHQDTPNEEPELHDNMIPNDVDVDTENTMVGGNMDSKNSVCPFQEGSSERDTTSELVGPTKDINEECGDYSHVFERGSVLVEYARIEACCTAAHCLHGRFFDGRMVTLEYIPLSLYRAKFTK